MPRLTLTDDRGINYDVIIIDYAPLLRCDVAARRIFCPRNFTMRELDSFSHALSSVDVERLPFRRVPVLPVPVN